MFAMDRTKPVEITVEARVREQLIINKFYYRNSAPAPGPSDGTSDIFLGNFAVAYQTFILPQFYDVYAVSRYWCRQIDDVLFFPAPPPGHWRNSYRPDEDFLEGTPADVGGIASAGLQFMPVHEALRVYKRPTTFVRRYFKSTYNRFAPFAENDQGDLPERWNVLFRTNRDTAFTNFNSTAIFSTAPPVGNGWFQSVWSPTYYGVVVKPAGGAIEVANPRVFSMLTRPYVGTQVSRRYNPSGGFRGA